jgi:hypothetical protein
MSNVNNEQTEPQTEPEPKPVPSPGPLKNEPTPERAAEEKKRMEEQGAEMAKPKPSGAV